MSCCRQAPEFGLYRGPGNDGPFGADPPRSKCAPEVPLTRFFGLSYRAGFPSEHSVSIPAIPTPPSLGISEQAAGRLQRPLGYPGPCSSDRVMGRSRPGQREPSAGYERGFCKEVRHSRARDHVSVASRMSGRTHGRGVLRVHTEDGPFRHLALEPAYARLELEKGRRSDEALNGSPHSPGTLRCWLKRGPPLNDLQVGKAPGTVV